MGGPNLEVFKFGCYVFFPILAMLKFGDPEWYETYVVPYKEAFWPPYETTHRPPKTAPEVHAELARLKAARLARQNQHQAQTQPTTSTSTTMGTEVETSSPSSLPLDSIDRAQPVDQLAPSRSAATATGGVMAALPSREEWGWAKDTDRRLV